ncbi:redoxin domain-containing protein [Bacillus sp. WBUNB001]
MQQFYSDYKKNNIIIIGVNLTDNESNTKQVKDFTKQYKISFPILLDTKGEIRKQYKIITIPTTYIIDSNGIIAENVIGPITYDKIKKLTLNSANIKKG